MKYFVFKKKNCDVFLEAGQRFSDDMEMPGREPARFCLRHFGGDECVWVPRQDSSATPVCNPGTIQSSAPIFQKIRLL